MGTAAALTWVALLGVAIGVATLVFYGVFMVIYALVLLVAWLARKGWQMVAR